MELNSDFVTGVIVGVLFVFCVAGVIVGINGYRSMREPDYNNEED